MAAASMPGPFSAPQSTDRRRRSSAGRRLRRECADGAGAIGKRITSLLNSDPRAIFITIGTSRAAENPWTYFGVTAAPSIIAPAAFGGPWTACPATSSTEAAAIRQSPPRRPAAPAIRSSLYVLPPASSLPQNGRSARVCGPRVAPARRIIHQAQDNRKGRLMLDQNAKLTDRPARGRS